MATKSVQQPKASRRGLFVSADGITTMTEARFGRELIRNVCVRNEDGDITAEHVILETTGRHQRLKVPHVRVVDESFADALLELPS